VIPNVKSANDRLTATFDRIQTDIKKSLPERIIMMMKANYSHLLYSGEQP
jgi:hypothetical protein